MKKQIILILITLSSYMLFAQETEATKTENKTKWTSLHEVDQVPIFKGCKGLETASQQRRCLQTKIQRHIAIKFNTDLGNDLGLESGKKRISVRFFINKKGIVENVKARAPHPALEDEAIRIVKLLPRMIPAKHKEKPVRVGYTLPIIFYIEGVDNTAFKNLKDNEAPIFPGCDSLAINLQKKCFKDKVTAHIAKKLNKKLADGLDLSAHKKNVYASFKINKDGKTVEVSTVETHRALGDEVERVLNLLPTMKPGNIDKKNIKVEYYLTIDFE